MSERDAVFETSDQILDLSSADLGRSKFERRLVREGAVRRGEPGTHLCQIAFEQVECKSYEAREANESIGLFGLEPFGVLAPGQGPGRNLKKLCRTGCRKVEDSPESFEGFIGEAFPNPGVELSSLVRAKAQERHIGVGAVRVGVDLAPEPVDGLGPGRLSDTHDGPPLRAHGKI
jgi:hypothetical protein